MAQQVDEVNFWLPLEFLTDDELLMDFKTDRCKEKILNDFGNGYVNTLGFSSHLSSPAESVMGSTEAESDEDGYIAWLTRKLAYSTLGDSNFSKGWTLSGSPKSTLCSTLTGCRCMPALSRVSRVSSPPCGEDAAAWLSLLAAAEKGASMRLIEETASFCSANPFVHSRKPDVIHPNRGSGFYPNPSRLSFQQVQSAEFQQLKQQKQASSYWGQGKIGHQQMVRNVKKNGNSGNQNVSMASSWKSVQHSQPRRQPSSGMRAVFLGESETKSKRTGTGVFLPKKLGAGASPVETRKKTGCLPDSMVNALSSNLKSMDAQLSQTLHKRSDLLEANAALKHRNTVSMVEQRNLRPVPAVLSPEFELPQEWTY